jgi:hypothetical protein
MEAFSLHLSRHIQRLSNKKYLNRNIRDASIMAIFVKWLLFKE